MFIQRTIILSQWSVVFFKYKFLRLKLKQSYLMLPWSWLKKAIGVEDTAIKRTIQQCPLQSRVEETQFVLSSLLWFTEWFQMSVALIFPLSTPGYLKKLLAKETSIRRRSRGGCSPPNENLGAHLSYSFTTRFSFTTVTFTLSLFTTPKVIYTNTRCTNERQTKEKSKTSMETNN